MHFKMVYKSNQSHIFENGHWKGVFEICDFSEEETPDRKTTGVETSYDGCRRLWWEKVEIRPANPSCNYFQGVKFLFFPIFLSILLFFLFFLAISSYFSYFLAILLTISKYLLEIWIF